MRYLFILIFGLFTLNSHSQTNITKKVKMDAKQRIEKFKHEPKFEVENSGEYYQGLSVPNLKSHFTELLNKSADEFIQVSQNHPTDQKYQQKIKIGLERFNPNYSELDTEDREKICGYVAELMNCVGLKSSDGIINKWLYGFDFSKKH
jgi:hypothetical protein